MIEKLDPARAQRKPVARAISVTKLEMAAVLAAQLSGVMGV